MSALTSPRTVSRGVHKRRIDVYRRVANRIRAICEVPPDETVTQFAERHLRVIDGGVAKGMYRSDLTPYQRRPQDLAGDPRTTMMALCWGSQLGKTLVLRHILAHRIRRMPSGAIITQPKIDRAESWVKEEFDVMVDSALTLKHLIRSGRYSKATMRFKPFPGGYLFVASAQSATELASRSAAFVGADEVDRYEILKGEGNPFEIIRRRSAAQDVSLLIATSTPRDDDTTLIWPLLEQGTNERYEVPCPKCGVCQELRWPNVKWPSGKPLDAVYECPHCAYAIVERTHKKHMLHAGEWQSTNDEGQYPSFHLSSLYSPFAGSRWGLLAQEFVNAHGKAADLQVFVNTRLAETWKEQTHQVRSDALAERANENLARGVVPVGVGALTMGGDVQDNRVELWIWGWGAGLESWPIDRIVIPGDPAIAIGEPDSPWNEVERIRNALIPHATGAPMRIKSTLIDSGYLTTSVYRYTDRRRGRGLYACKGVGESGQPLLGKPTLQTKGKVVVYPIGTNNANNEFLRSQILTQAPGAGFVHLPKWLTLEEIDQLVSMKRMRTVSGGVYKHVWKTVKEDSATEGLDCRNYARGALERLGPALIARLAKLATKAALPIDGETPPESSDDPPDDSPPEPPPETPPPPKPAPPTRTFKAPRKPGFVTNWNRRR